MEPHEPRPYEPLPGLAGPHRMTVAAALLPRGLGDFAAGGVTRDFVVDADTSVRAVCHWWRGPGAADRAALVLVHGLAGDADSPYMVGVAAKAHAAGLHAVRLNVRNCGGTEALTRRHYHGGITDDLLAVARELVDEGVPRVHLAGFSLGGNHVLRLAARLGVDAPSWLASTATLCPCLDFDAAVRRIDGPGLVYRLYRGRFLAALRRMVSERARLDGRRLAPEELAACRTLRAFDARFTAPLNGFRDVDDYYARASALAELGGVRVPSLLIAARDDPLVPFESLDEPRLRRNDALHLVPTRHGGHLGFLGRRGTTGDADRRWAENRLVEFVLAAERGVGPVRAAPTR